MNELPSQEALRTMFDFNHVTGQLFWKRREDRDSQWNGRYAGKEVGTVSSKGYRGTELNNVRFSLHRIIYKLAYGEMPKNMQIDHIDGDKLNNRLDNLRLVTNSENQRNRKADKGRKYKGVYKCKKGFKVEITHLGDRIYGGFFATERIAAFVYDELAREHHGEHANFNFPELRA